MFDTIKTLKQFRDAEVEWQKLYDLAQPNPPGGLGPWGFHPRELEGAIEQHLG
ncbi:MAG: hypothetical protein GY773_26230 [Actinomycetia bacterium]|nr:hypothetical protein [Actinomycetes bacterium]